MKAMRHLCVDLETPLNILIEEAAQDLLAKYGRQPKTDAIKGNPVMTPTEG
jgi:hypothetical protein